MYVYGGVFKEQLKMVGLVRALQVEEEVRGREKQLNTILRNKKAMKVHTCIHSIYVYNITD